MTTTPTTWHKPSCTEPRLSFWQGQREPMVTCGTCGAITPQSRLPIPGAETDEDETPPAVEETKPPRPRARFWTCCNRCEKELPARTPKPAVRYCSDACRTRRRPKPAPTDEQPLVTT